MTISGVCRGSSFIPRASITFRCKPYRRSFHPNFLINRLALPVLIANTMRASPLARATGSSLKENSHQPTP
jgi:hypothetical protein